MKVQVKKPILIPIIIILILIINYLIWSRIHNQNFGESFVT